MVLERLEPYLERRVQMLAKDVICKLTVLRRRLRWQIGEMKPETAANALTKFTGKTTNSRVFKPNFEIPARPAQLCPGCPYWLVFAEVKKAVDEGKVDLCGDIELYMTVRSLPHSLYDYMFCMRMGIEHRPRHQEGDEPESGRVHRRWHILPFRHRRLAEYGL